MNIESRMNYTRFKVYDAGSNITLINGHLIFLDATTGLCTSTSGSSNDDFFAGIYCDSESNTITAGETLWTHALNHCVKSPLAAEFNADGANTTGVAGQKVFWDPTDLKLTLDPDSGKNKVVGLIEEVVTAASKLYRIAFVSNALNPMYGTLYFTGSTTISLGAAEYFTIDAANTDHTGPTPFKVDVDINSSTVAAITAEVDVTTALSGTEIGRGFNADIDGNASDANGSFLIGYDALITSAGRSDVYGFNAVFDGDQPNADDTFGLRIIDTATRGATAKGKFYGAFISGDGATLTNNDWVGLYITETKVLGAGSCNLIQLVADQDDANNIKNGIVLSHDATGTNSTHSGISLQIQTIINSDGGNTITHTGQFIDIDLNGTATGTDNFSGNKIQFNADANLLISGNTSIWDIVVASDHDDAAGDVIDGINVAWSGGMPGTVGGVLKLVNAQYTGIINGTATVYSIVGDISGATFTGGTAYAAGYFTDALNLVSISNRAYGITILSDATNTSNAKQNILTSRDITGALTGHRTYTNYANVLSQVGNNSSATDFNLNDTANTSGVQNIIFSHLTTATSAGPGVLTTPDVFRGTAFRIDVTGRTNDVNTKLDMSARALDIAYTATETSGTLRLAATDIARIVATIPAGLTSAGAYTMNMLNLDGSAILNDDANMTLRGANINLSGYTTGAVMRGVNIVMPAAYTAAAEAAIYATGNGNIFGALTGDGIYLSMGEATSIGINLESDSTNANNDKRGIDISKDLTNSLHSVGGWTNSDSAIRVRSYNTTGVTADQPTTVNGDLVSVERADTTSLALADVYGGNLVNIYYDVDTTGAGTATSNTCALNVNYDLNETAGTMSVTAFNVAYIDFDTTGTPVFAAGEYNLLYINGNSNAASPAYTATTNLNGTKIDLSAMVVTDADLTMRGLSIVMPTAAVSNIEGIRIVTGSVGPAIYIDSATNDHVAGNLLHIEADVAALGGGDIFAASYINVDETVVGTDGTLIIGSDIIVSSFDTGRADVYGSRITLDGSKTTADDVYGLVINADGLTLNNAGATLRMLQIDFSALTNTTSDTVRGVEVLAPAGRTPAVDTNIRGTVSGRIEFGAPTFYDEMWAGEAHTAWATRTTTGVVAAVSGVGNGRIRLTTGAVAGNEESLDWNDVLDFTNLQRPTMEIGLLLGQNPTADSDIEVYVGLMNNDAGIDYEASAAMTEITFQIDDGAHGNDNWWLLCSNGGGAAVTKIDTTVAGSLNYVVLRFEFVSDTEVYAYINGVYVGLIATNIPAAAWLQPLLSVRTALGGGAGAKSIDVDYVKIWQDRT
jgi:hypothetical protein